MAQQQRQAFCPTCNQHRLHTRNTYNVPHILHLLLSCVTMGFWIPIWFLHALVNSRSSEQFLCTFCGTAIESADIDRVKQYASSQTINQVFKQAPPPPALLRTWTDRTGRFREEAAFISLVDGMVELYKADGARLVVPLSKLSPADLDWCRDLERLR